ncbi:Tetracycline resistance protein TetM [Streptomyces sp. YIM 130001]|uniref:elongation factor G n=1 Tax=Streptomyces sp. YIM 130001 TaxID=2259644 RepID=UPI000E655E83|nr:TetM/TetW/TetO/TetS family tetracycline resistance ribosomal protection protein [Streptomyces sp. YIM 130001]RII17034.1 Tetracycline resistance protein TetM [Streptomyces sp. YIM 130001]
MQTLNLGILAHVDAGKTSLTERLLHFAGVTGEIGSVDRGSTLTDSLDLERRRGITIRSAVVSFALGGRTVNLIDTPGHPDFIAEVERVLSLLDGAVLVVSAVEGVQAQTRILHRTLRRLGIPSLIFVNKIDRRGARPDEVRREITERLRTPVVAMGAVAGAGTADATCAPYEQDDAAFHERLTEVLAERDDELLAAYAEGRRVPYDRLRDGLAAGTGRCEVHPLYAGSAVTGAGTAELAAGIRTLLPAGDGDPVAPLDGSVFKIERGPAGEKIACVRVAAGTVRVRDRVRLRGAHAPGGTPRPSGGEAKVTALAVFEQGAVVPRREADAGRIAQLWGLADARIGDRLQSARARPGHHEPSEPDDVVEAQHFAPPTLETVVQPLRREDRGALHLALSRLAEQDPLIDLRRDDVRDEMSLSLYGEVQKEVVQATLADEFGIGVRFCESATLCIERPAGTGSALEVPHQDSHPFLATVGLRVEPGPDGSGVTFGLGVELGSMPYSFFRAVEETVHETFRQGLYGWQVTDCRVTMTHCAYDSVSTTSGDFRNLTPLVLMEALRRAGTVVHEPLLRFRVELPADCVGPLLPVLGRLGAVPGAPELAGALGMVEGEVPAARVHELEQRLPGLTRGEGVIDSSFARYAPVCGPRPERPRTDHNPLDRKEYLLQRVRRVTGGR